MSRLKAIAALGQSVWLDFIDRNLMDSGALARLIEADGVSGLTSNPAIFEKAIANTAQYDDSLRELLAKTRDEPPNLFERLAIPDIQRAADLMRQVYDRCEAADGYVSFEVAPHLHGDSEATVREARRLWAAIDRPNLMVKVPGTRQGIDAVRQLISEGININVTLLFSRAAYRATAEAYIDAVQARVEQGAPVSKLASVASFFVSRIDTEVDARIDARIKQGTDAAEKAALEALRGRIAIANAKLAYRDFAELFTQSPRWQKLEKEHGAQPQRLLWASTGTKNPHYRDVLYAESLIGPQTVDTMPPATVDAFRDHGEAQRTLDAAVDEAAHEIAQLERLGLSLESVTAKLLQDGLALFQDADDRLMAALSHKRERV